MTDLNLGADFSNGNNADAIAVNAKFSSITTLVNSTGVPKLQDGIVTTAKLADGAVTASKLDPAAVGTASIADGSLPATKLTTTVQGQLVPSGAMIDFAAATAPAGWLIADGSPVSRSTYASLFAVIGTTHGPGNGSTTFNLPDATGKVTAGKSAAGTFSTLGSTPGVESANIGVGELPAHTHSVSTSASYTPSGSVSVGSHGDGGNNNIWTGGGATATRSWCS